MSQRCAICGRGPEFGSKVSHSGRHSRRVRLPNLQRVHAVVAGRRGRIRVCTRCIKAGKVTKA
ncbi:MAG: 50S ribosomal protein L28 [Candidatus Bipolaricaulota bacterium]|nr:50S ribosomal protein L28 [Candidatus Bipolaricaulota bacterium]